MIGVRAVLLSVDSLASARRSEAHGQHPRWSDDHLPGAPPVGPSAATVRSSSTQHHWASNDASSWPRLLPGAL